MRVFYELACVGSFQEYVPICCKRRQVGLYVEMLVGNRLWKDVGLVWTYIEHTYVIGVQAADELAKEGISVEISLNLKLVDGVRFTEAC